MSNKYNLNPGARHFLPFSYSQGNHLQYSYHQNNIYCKQELDIAGTCFSYVEVRQLDEDDKSELDALASNDYIEPMRIFGRSSYVVYEKWDLDELYETFRQCSLNIEELRRSFQNAAPGSDEYRDAEALLDYNYEDRSDALGKIEHIIGCHNKASGYDPKTGKVRPIDVAAGSGEAGGHR